MHNSENGMFTWYSFVVALQSKILLFTSKELVRKQNVSLLQASHVRQSFRAHWVHVSHSFQDSPARSLACLRPLYCQPTWLNHCISQHGTILVESCLKSSEFHNGLTHSMLFEWSTHFIHACSLIILYSFSGSSLSIDLRNLLAIRVTFLTNFKMFEKREQSWHRRRRFYCWLIELTIWMESVRL